MLAGMLPPGGAHCPEDGSVTQHLLSISCTRPVVTHSGGLLIARYIILVPLLFC